MGSENTGGSPLRSGLFEPSPAYMLFHRTNGGGGGGGGGLVAKSCQTLTTPWTEARQSPLSMGILQARILAAAAAAAKSLQSCPTLCDPIDSSPPGSPVPGILQARTLEWVAISFSSA